VRGRYYGLGTIAPLSDDAIVRPPAGWSKEMQSLAELL
jgi:hypothetical protein